jgi:hypothetical protein
MQSGDTPPVSNTAVHQQPLTLSTTTSAWMPLQATMADLMLPSSLARFISAAAAAWHSRSSGLKHTGKNVSGKAI